MSDVTVLEVPELILLGPGPSMVHPRVLRALSQPVVGHLDTFFLSIMSEVQRLLRYVFETENQLTIPVSGTGSAGMEAALCNFIEPGDEVIIGVNGYFSGRMCEMAKRYGATIRVIEKKWGEIFFPEEIEKELKKKSAKLVCLVHAETSTGALQPIEQIARVTHDHETLFLMDCVTSLGGVPVKIDDWGVDIAYSGTQKCLSCPPGLAPLTVSESARQVLRNRKSSVQNWYLDLTMIEHYWGDTRTYHHTAPISMNYALLEALKIVEEEGLDPRFTRHRLNAEMLWDGLDGLGLELQIPLKHRLPSLTTVIIPENVDDLSIRRQLRNKYNIEIAGGLGQFAGRIWRIGLMGYSSRQENISILLEALENLLR